MAANVLQASVRKLAVINSGAYLAGLAVLAPLLAIAEFGVWPFVIGQIAMALITCVLSFYFCSHAFSFAWDSADASWLASSGGVSTIG